MFNHAMNFLTVVREYPHFIMRLSFNDRFQGHIKKEQVDHPQGVEKVDSLTFQKKKLIIIRHGLFFNSILTFHCSDTCSCQIIITIPMKVQKKFLWGRGGELFRDFTLSGVEHFSADELDSLLELLLSVEAFIVVRSSISQRCWTFLS